MLQGEPTEGRAREPRAEGPRLHAGLTDRHLDRGAQEELDGAHRRRVSLGAVGGAPRLGAPIPACASRELASRVNNRRHIESPQVLCLTKLEININIYYVIKLYVHH